MSKKLTDPAWTVEDVLTLLRAMRDNVPKQRGLDTYRKQENHLKWKNVAFHPHSAQACQKKWQQILQKMRKFRSLTELIDEAEESLAKPNCKIHPDLPKRPKPPNAIFYEENFARLQMQHPKLSRAQLMKLSNELYNDLPTLDKNCYIQQFKLASKVYRKHWKKFNKKYNHVTRSRRSIKTHGFDDDDSDNNENGSMKADWPPPAPPRNCYILFCNEIMASPTCTSSSCKEQWRKLSDTQKQEYKNRHEQLKKEYTEAMKQYSPVIDEEQSPEQNGLEREEQGKKRKSTTDNKRSICKEEQESTKHRTSDSEDEAIEDSSSDGETILFSSSEEDEDKHLWYSQL